MESKVELINEKFVWKHTKKKKAKAILLLPFKRKLPSFYLNCIFWVVLLLFSLDNSKMQAFPSINGTTSSIFWTKD